MREESLTILANLSNLSEFRGISSEPLLLGFAERIKRKASMTDIP